MDTLAKFAALKKHADLIIDTVMDTIGDDFESDEVNYVALMTLVALLKVVPAKTVICRMAQIGKYPRHTKRLLCCYFHKIQFSH